MPKSYIAKERLMTMQIKATAQKFQKTRSECSSMKIPEFRK